MCDEHEHGYGKWGKYLYDHLASSMLLSDGTFNFKQYGSMQANRQVQGIAASHSVCRCTDCKGQSESANAVTT